MTSTAQPLPPKMALSFAARAARGESDRVLDKGVHIFYQGTTEIVLVGLNPAVGHLRKMNAAEQKEAREYMAAKKSGTTSSDPVAEPAQV